MWSGDINAVPPRVAVEIEYESARERLAQCWASTSSCHLILHFRRERASWGHTHAHSSWDHKTYVLPGDSLPHPTQGPQSSRPSPPLHPQEPRGSHAELHDVPSRTRTSPRPESSFSKEQRRQSTLGSDPPPPFSRSRHLPRGTDPLFQTESNPLHLLR